MEFLELENLSQIQKTFSVSHCDFLIENCIVALENNNHNSGCMLTVSGDQKTEISLKWKRTFKKGGYKEARKIIEHAAEVLSFVLSAKLTDYTVIEEALIGTGIDYWLGYEETDVNYNPKNFIRARLEVSGINKESSKNTIANRVKIKMEQTVPSDGYKLPAYISIVEFGTPKAYFRKK